MGGYSVMMKEEYLPPPFKNTYPPVVQQEDMPVFI